jgi:hypothetical protein
MKKFLYFAVSCMTLMSAAQAHEFPIEEIEQMGEQDNAARERWIEARGTESAAEIAKEIRSQEVANSARIKEILIQYGRGIDDESLESLYRLVLHSSDIGLQKQYLEMLALSDTLLTDVGDLITDRILLREGKPQRYGSHFHHQGDAFIPYEIENLEILDDLRAKFEEPPMEEYSDFMRTIAQSIEEKDDAVLYRATFNMMYDFSKKIDDYLYYATFDQNGKPPMDERGVMAFEDPSLAATYLLSSTTDVWTDAVYTAKRLAVTVRIQKDSDAIAFTLTPVFFYLVPKTHFQSHTSDLEQILISQETVEPVAEFQCDSMIEALIITGSQLKIVKGDTTYEYRENSLPLEMMKILFFDVTLENEIFDTM